LREEPGYAGVLRTKAIACAHLDRIDEAHAAVGQWIEAQPGLTIERYKAFWSRSFSPEVMAIAVEGLRKAGLPEG